MSEAPALCIQIVTWNSAGVIEACLASLLAQTRLDFDLIVVDNASEDDTVGCVERAIERGLHARLIRSPHNVGFCGGQNLAAARSAAPWVMFLNPDTTLPADFVARACDRIAGVADDIGTLAPLILLPDGNVDSTGLFLDRFRRVFDRGQGRAPAPALREEDVMACTGAAPLHRRAMLLDVAENGQILDERLFAFYDDLDLSWRAQLRGWRCRFVPDLALTHRRAGRNALRQTLVRKARAYDQRLTLRNRLLVLLKCESGRDALAALPWLIPYELARLVFVAIRAPRALLGYVDAVQLAPSFWRSRRLLFRRARSARLRAEPFFPHQTRDAA